MKARLLSGALRITVIEVCVETVPAEIWRFSYIRSHQTCRYRTMPETEIATDTGNRGVSELVSVITLLGFVLAIVLALGLSVLFLQPQSSAPSASFSFTYNEEAAFLLITHSGGEQLEAGNVVIQGPEVESTWAQINTQMNNASLVGPDDAIRIGPQNAYGDRVGSSDRIQVLYRDPSTNETSVLSEWSGADAV